MGKVVRWMNWSDTPLGPLESWPQSLRTTVSLCLASNFPISIAWGPDRVQIYNDGYWPICGAKHPHAMGLDFKECWYSAWAEIGAVCEQAQAGRTSYIENQRMFLDRNGYLEETFFTFSFSPIRDETGEVGGLIHPVADTTAKMLMERRNRALRDLAAQTTTAKTVEDACSVAARVLADHSFDLPFVLLYPQDASGTYERWAGAAGIGAGTCASPGLVGLTCEEEIRQCLERVSRSRQPELVRDLEERWGTLSHGPYPELPQTVLVLPIPKPGLDRLAGVVVAAVSPRLPLDDTYRGFYDQLAGHLTIALANASAYEEDRRKSQPSAELDLAQTALFTNVSHEFRTPLTLMLRPLEDLLKRDDLPDGTA